VETLKCGHPHGCWREGSKTCGWCVAANKADIAQAEAAIANAAVAELNDELFHKTTRCMELTEQLAELEALFDQRYKADQRAVARWHAAHPNSGVGLPDRADMVFWMLENYVDVTYVTSTCDCVYPRDGVAYPDCVKCSGTGTVVTLKKKVAND